MDENCYNFVVASRPVAYWSHTLHEDNAEFLRGLDARYFSEQVEWLGPQLDTPNRSRAAIAIRLLYGHSLETLFALIAAAVQAPRCPLAWMLSYTAGELREVVNAISTGSLSLARMRGPITWTSVGEEIHRFTIPDRKLDEWVKTGFADSWARMAYEFTEQSFIDEHNSLKHGLRVKHGGFSLRLGPADADAPATLESASEFGTSYFARVPLAKYNITAERVALNWDPVSCARGIELVALGINNVTAYLKMRSGGDVGEARFLWPTAPENAFEAPFEASFIIESARKQGIQPADVPPRTAEDILRTFTKASGGR